MMLRIGTLGALAALHTAHALDNGLAITP